MAITPPPRGANPFDDTGVQPDGNGVRRYPNLHESLVEMLSDSVRADPHAEALVEVGGERISYTQLWDRAARVSGGLARGRNQPRRPGRDQAAELDRLGGRVLRRADGRRRRRAGQHPARRTRGGLHHRRLRQLYVFEPGSRAARRQPAGA